MTQQKIDDGGVGVHGTGSGDARCAKCGAQLEVISTRMWLEGMAMQGILASGTSAGEEEIVLRSSTIADAIITGSKKDESA